jgi:hypothetical protein
MDHVHLRLLLIALLVATSAQAKPLAPADVPDMLKPWIGWALWGNETRACPLLYDVADTRRCAWPTRLELSVDERLGTFRMVWEVQQESRVVLPGSAEMWPQGVEVDGKPALVSGQDGQPGTLLQPGAHTVSGRLVWDSLPESVPVPRDSGLIALTVKGQAMSQPVFNEQGQLWIEGALQAREEKAEIANRLDLQVFRQVADETPVKVTTWLTLDVSGEQRDVLLEGAMLPEFIPLSLESPLPARVEPDGKLRLQMRPGHWTVQLVSRSPQELTELALPQGLPEPWPVQEVWAFEAHPDIRTVEIEGVPAVDPQQTNLPEIWKTLPAYRLEPGQTMSFRVLRKGDPEPEPDALDLRRNIWLDFDGTGYTINDEIGGRMTRNWRLNIVPPVALGRVSLDGEAQPITRLGENSPAGVEVRRGQVRLSADSRFEGGIGRMPAVGWDQDFRSVSARLNLPPGWKLLAASGVDNAPETWVGRWTLLDLFMVLIASLAMVRLWDWPRGLLALATLVLLWHEPEAPRGVWLNLLAAVALLRVLPTGRFATGVRIYRNVGFAALLFIALPFMVDQVRLGLYPQLEQSWLTLQPVQPMAPAPEPAVAPDAAMDEVVSEEGGAMSSAPVESAKRMMSMAKPMLAPPAAKAPGQSSARFREIDPNALTQTGPGLPRWNWNSVSLSWSGPVMRGQELGLVLLSPMVNLVLNLLRVALLLALAWVLIDESFRPRGKKPDTPKAPEAEPEEKPTVGWVRRALNLRMGVNGTIGGRRNPPKSVYRWVTTCSMSIVEPIGNSECASNPPYDRPLRWRCALLAALLSGFTASARAADYPTDAMLQELKSRLLEAPDCLPRCADIPAMRVKLQPGELQLHLEVHAEQAMGIPLPGQEGQWLPGKLTIDGAAATAAMRSSDGKLWIAVKPGHHEVLMAGPMPARAEVIVPLPLQPRHVTLEGSGWSVQGIGENGVPESQLQFSRELPADQNAGNTLEPRPLPAFMEVSRTLQIGLDWRVQTQVRRVSPSDAPATVEVPLLEGESVTTPGLTVKNGKLLVNLSAGQEEMGWEAVLEKRPVVSLLAPDTRSWTEAWRVDVSPIWHLSADGIAPVHHQDGSGNWLPEWRPWPGEGIKLKFDKPQGVPGASLTIDSSQFHVKPGQRATDSQLKISLRSTQGGQHGIKLPEGAVLQSALVDGRTQPLRQQGQTVSLPIHPGEQSFELNWREDRGIAGRFAASPVNLGIPSVNVSETIHLGQDRWVLLAGGPRLGPAILFWGVLFVLLLIGAGLARLPLTPLKTRHWMLLLIGLSQLDLAGAALVVVWLMGLGWRGKEGAKLERTAFNLLQTALGLLTLAALGLLFAAVEQGLLGLPDMQVAGNDSTASTLNWYQDRSPAELPMPWVVSAPLWSYRVLMLVWALWLAYSLLNWLRWGWECLGVGGLWRSKA